MPGANRDQTGSDPRSLSCCGTPHFFPQSVARWAASPSWWVSLVTPDGRQPRHASETGSGVRTPCVSSCELRPSPPCPASVDHSPLLASRTHSPGSMPPPCLFPAPCIHTPRGSILGPLPTPQTIWQRACPSSRLCTTHIRALYPFCAAVQMGVQVPADAPFRYLVRP